MVGGGSRFWIAAVVSLGAACSRSGLEMPVQCRTDVDCPDAMACEDGRCVPDDQGCGMQTLGHRPAPNVVVLLDRSSSMNDPIDGVRKWDIAISSLRSVLPEFDDRVRFGLMMFPGPEADCQPGQVDVEVGDGSAAAVLAALPADPLFTTPIGSSLAALGAYAGLADGARENFILLITDGFESCGDDPVWRAEGLAARKPPVRVHVVGFGDLVDPDALTRIAEAAGTARAGSPAYWRAGDSSELSEAIAGVGEAVLPCTYALDRVPPSDTMWVFLGSEPAERDRARIDGWDWDAERNEIGFFGVACDEVRLGRAAVSVVFGCP